MDLEIHTEVDDRRKTGTAGHNLPHAVTQLDTAIEPWVYRATHDSAMIARVTKCLHAARARDGKRGRLSTLTRRDVEHIAVRAGGRCELTGIPFSLDKASGSNRRPFAPTLDRIDNALPYSLENCRLVCLAINIGVNEWGEATFAKIARAFLAKALEAHEEP